MLSNISIGTRIALLVAASVVTLGLLGGTVTVGAQRMFEATAELDQFRDAYEHTAAIERRASRLRFQALRFVADRDETAAEAFAKNAEEASRLLENLKERGVERLPQEELDHLSQGIGTLKERFSSVVARAKELGLSDDSGLRGVLRASARAIEDELKQWPNADKLTGRMESMRKMEKDFIIYSDESLLSGHRKAFNEFTFFLADSGLDTATQTRLEKQARTYRTDLGRFVDATKAFRAEVQTFNDAFQAMVPRFEALLESANAGMAGAVETQNRVRGEVIANVFQVGSVLLVGFAIISLLVARSITRPLRLIEGVMERLAGGDRTATVPETGRRDEIGAMARAVSVFKENLQRTHELEQESRRAERRAEEERETALRAIAHDFDSAFGRVLHTVSHAADQIRNGAHILRDTAEKMKEQALDTSEKAEQTSEVVGIVNNVSRTLSASIGEIGGRVTTSSTAIRRAVDHARQSDSAVAALADSSQRIGEIVRLINDIAGQRTCWP
ncbi:hypothetical protein C1S70_01940 [Azospirillum argentinense]|uniref:HAMP domain-containing protein n=1 Tax=Azospirillum argentinense TaxID=2970906 RepID=A0A2K1G7X2_9PROT|nr:methyl-accepting chemotaxis protein [Azospirillum argentinense]PNR00882.1 hypothetical protein C1S70_01940 [Azospirillum argentinense]